MNEVNRTLYIPLYGKAYVTERGILLKDPKAQEIWKKEGFQLKGKSASKWLAYYMAIRGAVFDRWTEKMVRENPDAVVLHLGCGMDSRVLRAAHENVRWFDVDFPEVIQERRKYFEETDHCKMLGCDIRNEGWLREIPGEQAIVVMEGVSMYLTREELVQAMKNICGRFDRVNVLMDCYSEFAAKASKYKNPINDVGVTQVYGMDDPKVLEKAGLEFIGERDMTPASYMDQLSGLERTIFRKLYAGKIAGKMYRMYEFRKGERK